MKFKHLALAALLAPCISLAEINPQQGPADPRVRVVDYNPMNVVKITAFYGVSTHIQFAADETITDVANGDSAAWQAIARSQNHLFIKPLAENADANLTVVTSKRVYQFALVLAELDRQNPKSWKDPSLIYSLQFRYPDELAAAAKLAELTAKSREQKKKAAETVEQKFSAAKQVRDNYDYWLAGSDVVSPTEAFDDKLFTRLVFGNNREIPAIFAVDENGKEKLVNSHMEGNTVVVHSVHRKLILRRGDFAACLVNKAFSFDGGNDNKTGTISPEIKRVIKGASQ